MGSKRITLSIDSEIYERYKKYCERKGIIISKQVEFFMKDELKKRGEK